MLNAFSSVFTHRFSISAILVSGLNASYWKPIQSGMDGTTDTEFVKDKVYKDDGLFETRPFPHAPYSCSPALLKEVFKLAKKSGVPTGIHLGESPDETDFIRKKTNKPPQL